MLPACVLVGLSAGGWLVGGAGAEVIPFLKTYVNLPAALAITIVYSKLCNAMPMSKVGGWTRAMACLPACPTRHRPLSPRPD